ncbi:MAG TPA: amino acid permease, partial [Actinoallomurus sp.]|nr:amino acid permease [Actinoallomurus sp.]
MFFAFAGWEAVSHLSADFADPGRSLPRATVLALLIVGTLYLGLAITVVGALGDQAAASPVPLSLLLQEGVGDLARETTGVVAVILTFIAVNTYIAGGAKLGAALARDGALPTGLAGGAAAGQVPHRSLLVLASMTGLVTVVVIPSGFGLDTLMRATAACLAAVTLVGMAAAMRLLPRGGRRHGRAIAGSATVSTGLMLLSCGLFLLVPAAIAAVGALVVHGRGRGREKRRPPEHDSARSLPNSTRSRIDLGCGRRYDPLLTFAPGLTLRAAYGGPTRMTEAIGAVRGKAGPPTAAGPVGGLSAHALVDRGPLIAGAREHLAGGGSVLLTGPAGIGKSTLLSALAGEVADHQVLHCSLSETERHLPFLGLIDLLAETGDDVL